MKKIFIGNLILLFLILMSNLYVFFSIESFADLAIQSEGGLQNIESNLFSITIVGREIHTVTNYTAYLIIIAIVLDVCFLIKSLNKKQ